MLQRTVTSMMIKNKFNFFVGILCGLSFVVNVARGRDPFMIGLTACLAIANFICAFVER